MYGSRTGFLQFPKLNMGWICKKDSGGEELSDLLCNGSIFFGVINERKQKFYQQLRAIYSDGGMWNVRKITT